MNIVEEILKYASMVQAVAGIIAPKYNKGVALGVAAAKIAAQLWNDTHEADEAVVLPEDEELIAILMATATRGRKTGEDFLDSVA